MRLLQQHVEFLTAENVLNENLVHIAVLNGIGEQLQDRLDVLDLEFVQDLHLALAQVFLEHVLKIVLDAMQPGIKRLHDELLHFDDRRLEVIIIEH